VSERPSLDDIAARFGPQARLYAVNPVDQAGATLERLLERMDPVMDERLLDLGCGPAHVAHFFAPYVRSSVGFDVSSEMLEAARLGARRKSIESFAVVRGDVHRLPFCGRSFDLVTCRAAAHHFADPEASLAEGRRVLRLGGRLGLMDGMVPEDDELETLLHELDRIHDPTTMRRLRPTGWRAMLERVGLRVDALETDVREDADGRSLAEWIACAGGSTAMYDEARELLLDASDRVRAALRIEEREGDVRFDLPRVLIVARRVD